MLRVASLQVSYDGVPALHDVSLAVEPGEIVAVVGANGAGKTTLLKTISGLLRPARGSITLDGQPLHRLPAHAVVARGVAHVPEGRRVFARQSVLQNLRLGAFTQRDRQGRAADLERVFALFPVLRERQSQAAGTLSGGEQQQLAIARGMMSRPRLLMLDEPSLGLAPRLVDGILQTIRQLNASGTTILLVEQNVREALELAHRAYLLQTGRTVLSGTGAELLQSEAVRRAYLGL